MVQLCRHKKSFTRTMQNSSPSYFLYYCFRNNSRAFSKVESMLPPKRKFGDRVWLLGNCMTIQFHMYALFSKKLFSCNILSSVGAFNVNLRLYRDKILEAVEEDRIIQIKYAA